MEKIVVIKTVAQLEELKRYIAENEYIAFDTETTGLDKESNIIGFSISADPETAYYVILNAWNTQTQKLEELPTFGPSREILSSLTHKKLILQNSVFDCSMVLNRYGIDLMPAVYVDTLLLGHLLNENRSNGLKERAVELYGEDSRREQKIMRESILKNGGLLTKSAYELYKADPDLIAQYGAKDAILTIKLFYNDIPLLFDAGLEKFFFDDETMPLVRGPTYDMNTTGLRVDMAKLQLLKQQLEAECLEAKGFIYKEIAPYIKNKYPGTCPSNTFNIDACQQRSWLIFHQLGEYFGVLTLAGKELCKALELKLPYALVDKRNFIRTCEENKGRVWKESVFNVKTKKMGKPKKIADSWTYMSCGKETLTKLASKYKWIAKYLEYAKNMKLLNTYVQGIQDRVKYGIIHPQFLQHGTTSGRYSCKNPNFQNLPRDDKRVKECIIARPGKVFVGADYSQLEPRIFASLSGDERLIACFKNGDDFYSVIGVEVFDKHGYSVRKNDLNSFAMKFPELREIAKKVALSATYGTTAPKLSGLINMSIEKSQEILNNYFERFPNVYEFMLSCHKEAKERGYVTNLFGRPRRMPEAKNIRKLYGNQKHSDLPYDARNWLNLAVNHRIQSTAASLMNRAAIKVWETVPRNEVKIVSQIHDQLILECDENIADSISEILKFCMEDTTHLPNVSLIAEPFISKDLAGQK
jgi:DNA polymerase I-like protein with 3'-5' exonuclease and polymerase domains